MPLAYLEGHLAIAPRFAHPNFFYKKSTGMVHGPLARPFVADTLTLTL